MRQSIVSFVVLAVTGCGPSGPSPAPAPVERAPMLVRAPFDRTWDATLDRLAEHGLPVRMIDRTSGFIATNVVRIAPPKAEPPARASVVRWTPPDTTSPKADCTQPDGTTYDLTFASYSVRVHVDSAGSRVQVFATFSGARNETSMAKRPCRSLGVFETNLERAIKAKAERGP